MTKSATGAHLPSAAESLRRAGEITDRVKTGMTSDTGLFERLAFLPGLDIKGFIGTAWEALEKVEPFDREDKVFKARYEAAEDAWTKLQAKPAPTGQDFDKCIELIAAAAIATQSDDSSPPREDDKPAAVVTAAYAGRKPAPKKPTKPAARVVKPANPLTTAGAKSIYSARRNLSK